MRHFSLLLLAATACSAGRDEPAPALISQRDARWDGTYIGAFYQRDWRCPQLRDNEAMIVEHGALRMPWHIHGAEDGSWAGFDVGQLYGVVHEDGTAVVAAEVTARALSAAMIATGYTASSSAGGIAALKAAVPQIVFRIDDEGRHATFVLSTDCILDLGVVDEQPRLPVVDAVDNPYRFAGIHLTQRAAADQFFDLDQSPGGAYSFSARVRTVFASAPIHRVIRCIQRSCSVDPADPGWVAYGWYDAPSAITTDTHVEILDPIRFIGSAAQIADTSAPTLDALANTLNGNPSILAVEIDVHAARRSLAQERAEAVVAALATRGIALGRLRAVGVLDTADTPVAPEVVIVRRAP